MKTAVIVGCDGQDGSLLFDLLASRGYRLLGLRRGAPRRRETSWRRSVDIARPAEVEALIARLKPDELYYLAAYHHSSEDAAPEPVELFRRSLEVHTLAPVHFLEAIRRRSPKTRFFYAASSRVYGTGSSGRRDERSPAAPDEAYGISKAAGLFACRWYRRLGVYASAGILFNHESPSRRPEFVSRKIVQGAVAVRAGRRSRVVLGDLDARADWGWAPDFVEAMRRILSLPKPDDFVVATGRTHTVRDFARLAAVRLGLDWKSVVRADGAKARPQAPLVGEARKLRRMTGWRPTVSFEGMIRKLVEAEARA